MTGRLRNGDDHLYSTASKKIEFRRTTFFLLDIGDTSFNENHAVAKLLNS